MPEIPPKINPVRTFKADIEKTIKSENISLSDVALAEEKRRRSLNLGEMTAPTQNWSWKMGAGIGVVILLGLLILSKVANLLDSSPKNGSMSFGLPAPIIPADDSKEIQPQDLKVEVLQSNQKMGQLRYLYFTENKALLETSRFFNNLETSIPSAFLRNLDREFMLGTYQNKGFLILKTKSYELAFSGMLEWEKNMADDLLPILSGRKVTGSWEDRVVKNRDARVLKEDSGNLALIYAFLNRNTLLIAPDETIFSEALSRFNAPRSVIR